MSIRNAMKAFVISSVLLTPLAHAQWMTKVEDDVFTGGKKATMIGNLRTSPGVVVFDCTNDKLSLAYVEENKSSESITGIDMDLIMKIDGNSPIHLDASMTRRNANYMQTRAENAAVITTVLKQLQSAKSKVLIGIQTKDVGTQGSATGNTAGSTAATKAFIKACAIKI